MPGSEIRDATIADLDALLALEADVFPGDRLSRRSLSRLIAAPTARVRLVGRAGAPDGYALVLVRAGSAVARLYSIAVARRARGAGLGSRLLADAERQAARRGRRVLRLEVRADNAAAAALYRARGYRPIGQVAAYYADGETALRFEKAVAPAAVPRRGAPAERRAPRGS